MGELPETELTMGERKTKALWLRARARSIAEMRGADVRVSSVAKLLHFGDRPAAVDTAWPQSYIAPISRRPR
jgi:hypothetical protein